MFKPNRRSFLAMSSALASTSLRPRWAKAQTTGAEALKSTLTPLGGLRAGNAEGTIPAWTGELIPLPSGYQSGDPRPDPFSGEKPRLTITEANVSSYQNAMPAGAAQLLSRFPSYRMDVYPTHRTGIAPQYVYDFTAQNVTGTTIAPDENAIFGAYGGVPFPIPTTGKQVMWNHLLCWQGVTIRDTIYAYQVTSAGQVLNRAKGDLHHQWPYYFEDGKGDFNGIYYELLVNVLAPAYEEGESQLVFQPVNPIQNPPRAWAYLPGERRTRLAPEFEYDTPLDVAGGVVNWDETEEFYGPLDEYDVKIVGKKEMLVPYNMNRAWAAPLLTQFQPNFYNADLTRWELHRVWVLEMTLAPGKRNVDARRVMYVDEDTWCILAYDIYDASGALWKYGHSLPALLSDVPCHLARQSYVVYDFHSGSYATGHVVSEERQWEVIPRLPKTFYTPGQLTATAGGN